jgi:thiol-disulfide isomerase/thioredoxin
MNRRQFLGSSLLATTSMRTVGQTARAPLRFGGSESLVQHEGSLPDLGGADHWFTTSPVSKRSLRGKVVLVNFWTYSCINSLRPLPYLKSWATQYKNDGLVVLGVHTPEFAFEKERANVDWAVREFNVSYAVAMDNEYRIWRAFKNQYWPAFYLFDEKGSIRYSHFGEGQYDGSERMIRKLLQETGVAALSAEPVRIAATGIEAAPGAVLQTPETYVGYRRAERFSSPERISQDARKTYTAPANLRSNRWGLSGVWEIGAESGLLREAHGKLALRFNGRDLHLVLAPTDVGKALPFRVRLEGAAPGADAGTDVGADGAGEVRKPRLYQLIRQKRRVRERLFEIEFLERGVRAFSFTFG